MGVGGTVLGSLALCLVLALIIEIKDNHGGPGSQPLAPVR